MFGIFRKIANLLMIILFVAGCSASSSVNGGLDPSETLVLDDDYEYNVSLDKGDLFALDMLIPITKGYRIVGTSFDPVMFKLEHYLEYTEYGESRARYLFLVLAEGASDILVKMEPLAGGAMDVYKQVNVKVGGNTGLF